MTYDVQRWTIGDKHGEPVMAPVEHGYFVLAADAEAHEKEAVRQAVNEVVNGCITAAEDLGWTDAANELRRLLT